MEAIEFNQHTSDNDIKKALRIFYYIHFKAQVIRLLAWASLLLSITIFVGTISNPSSPESFPLFTVVGGFLMSAYFFYLPRIFLVRNFKVFKKSKLSDHTGTVTISTDHQFTFIAEQFNASFPLSKIYAYQNHKAYILLFLTPQQFFIINKQATTDEQEQAILGVLQELHIMKMRAFKN